MLLIPVTAITVMTIFFRNYSQMILTWQEVSDWKREMQMLCLSQDKRDVPPITPSNHVTLYSRWTHNVKVLLCVVYRKSPFGNKFNNIKFRSVKLLISFDPESPVLEI